MEEVTVIDPRHALYGQTLRLVKFHGDGKARGTCTVELQKDIWRRIPVSVTDCGHHEPMVYPLPLNLLVVGQLLDCIKHIAAMHQEESNNEARARKSGSRIDASKTPIPNNPKSALGSARAKAPTTDANVSDTDLPADNEGQPSAAGGNA